MAKYTVEQLQESIEKDYGFKKELIKNPVLCGLWHLRFEVNGIRYYGCTSFSGALPQLHVEGYTHTYYDHDTPVEESYFNEFIKGKRIVLKHCIDPEAGDWELTDAEFDNQEEAKAYVELSDPNVYDYEFCD